MRNRFVYLIAVLLMCSQLVGCQAETAGQPAQLTPVDSPPEQPASEADAVAEVPVSAIESISVVVQKSKGSGIITDASAQGEKLNDAQKQVLTEYINLYYQSLADLNAGDPTELFANDAQEQALARQSAWQVIIDVRKMQKVDLSLTAFSWHLDCTEISVEESGDISVFARENSVQNFTAFPGVDSESHNVYHRYVLTDTADGWKLRSHMQMDSANMVALGRTMFRGWRDGNSGAEDIDLAAQLAEQRENVLAAHTVQLAERNRQAAANDIGQSPSLTWTHDYDREAAVAYAMEWVEKRNTDSWPVYDRNGGNCANFTSQCLLAGGIPMDYLGSSQWKWYGDTPNTVQSATGRSGAWSGVNEFYTYVTNNTGYGMITEPDANFWSGEPGDLIQLGYEDDWRHVVIITDVIKDDSGKTVDYLINSNTADQRSYPVSAYLYPQQRLIRICGWIEG